MCKKGVIKFKFILYYLYFGLYIFLNTRRNHIKENSIFTKPDYITLKNETMLFHLEIIEKTWTFILSGHKGV